MRIRLAKARAEALSPSSRMASAPGPMKAMFEARHFSAKTALSARKP
jgi:hypothetical protein